MRRKAFLVTFSLFFCCIFVRAHIPDTLLLEPVAFVETFVNLDKSRVQTGILEDYGANPIDFSLFDGRLNCSSRANIYDVYNILLGINASTVNTNNTPPNAIGMISSMSSYLESTTHVPIGIAAYKYTKFRQDAVSTGRLQVAVNEIVEVQDVYDPNNNNVWVDPYTEEHVFAFSPYLNVVGRAVTFDFSTSFRYTNLSIDLIQFNPCNGTGFQTVTNTSIPVYYTSPGHKTLELRIKLSDNTWLYAYSDLCVTNDYDCSVSPSYASFTSHVASNDGTFPSAEVDVLFSNGNATGFSKQPIIVAELFDPVTDPLGLLFHKSDSLVVPGRGARDINTFRKAIADSFLSNFDLVYINWNNSTASIESNADILKQVISWVNDYKYPGTRNILIGQSMGGLIARYALCDMEANNQNHEVAVYVSDDSPHLGANVPLGLQYGARHILDRIPLVSAKPLIEMIMILLRSSYLVYFNQLMSLIDGPAVKQMLKYYVNEDYELDNSIFNSFQQSLRGMGFPSGDSTGRTLCVALSNGGINNFVDGSEPIIEYSSIRTVGEYLNALLYFIADVILDNTIGWDIGDAPLKNIREAHIRALPSEDGGDMVYESFIQHTKTYEWDTRTEITPLHKHYAPSNASMLDINNGSYYPINPLLDSLKNPFINLGSPNWWKLVNKLSYQDKIMFVPTASALCYKKGENPLTASDYNRDYLTSGVDMDMIPFDGFRFYSDTATSHTSINYHDIEWICSIQNLSIVDTVYSDGSRQYFLNESGFTPAWSTSAPTIATINNSGQLTISGYGDVVIYATVGDSQNKLRLKKELHIPPPPLSGFPTYSLAARDMTLEGVFDHDDFHVTATPSAQIDSTIAPYVRYCWGRKVGSSNSITWTESNSRSKLMTMGINEDHMAYFKVRYLNYYFPTYSVLCHARPRIVIIDPFGNLYTEDMGGESFIQVKGSSEQWEVTCMEESVVFDHNPSLSEICTEMLNYPAFKNKVKEVRPWGEEERVVIPYLCEKSGSGNVVNDVIVFIYREV